jgi:hypothetical protein
MKIFKLIVTILLLSLLFLGCENVNEPISIEEGAVPAFVIIETEGQNVVAGASLEVEFQLGQTQEENVTVEYSISGDAVEGEDYVFAEGTPGTVTIEHDPESTSFDRGSVELEFPIEAALGTARNLVFTLESAVTESGESLSIGRGDIGIERTYVINGLGEATEGTYDYSAVTSFGDFDGILEITKPADPVIVGGNPYLYVTNKIAADAGDIFGSDVAYAFNVTAAGDVLGAPNAHEDGFETIVLDVGGTYDFDTDEIFFDVVFQCCGVEGAQILKTATIQP